MKPRAWARRRWRLVASASGLLALAIFAWFADPDYPGLTEVSRPSRLIGLEERELVAELGPPDRTREFTMADCCTELDGSLMNHLPPRGVSPEDAVVRVFTWSRLRYMLTVWTYRHDESGWRAVDTIAVGNLAPSF